MKTKLTESTINQEIEQLNQDILRSNKGELNGEEISGTFEMAIKIISKLQAENQALLAKNGELQEVVKMQGEALKKYSLVGNAHGILYAKEALEKSKQILGE